MTISFYSGGTSGNTRSRLNADTVQTVRSSAGDIISYSLPAGTLDSDGDYFLIDWTFSLTGAPTTMQVRITFDGALVVGSAYSTPTPTPNIFGQYQTRLTRTSTTTYAFTSRFTDYVVPSPPTWQVTTGTGTLSSGTWASTAFPIVGQINAYTAGTLTNLLWTISLYTS